MNPEPTDRRDAESLDAFWDELVLDQLTGRIPRAASSANEEMVMNLRSLMSPGDAGAEAFGVGFAVDDLCCHGARYLRTAR